MMINDDFRKAFDALAEKYTELLLGESSPETVEKIKLWAIFGHIHKTMPALVSHWNASHPDQKAAVRELFEEIRDKGKAHREGISGGTTSDSNSGQPVD